MKMSDSNSAVVASFSCYKRTFEDFCAKSDERDNDGCHSVTSSEDTDGEDSICQDSEEEREENYIVKNIVSAAIAKPRGGLAQLLDKQLHRTPSFKKQRVADQPKRLGLHSLSAPELLIASFVSRPKASQTNSPFERERTNPDNFLQSLLQRQNMTYKTVPSMSLTGFFTKPTEPYDLDLIQAVRNGDLDSLRLKAELGQAMQCANTFGHTLIHTAARRGATEIVRFFLTEANNVSPKVVCDMGRTPLHDACWTAKPNFEIIELLLDASPDLLFITDKRGYTPMAYVPKENWCQWCIFLEQRGAEKLQPREIF